jgi:TP901 family phage tail tape measure protein
MTSQTQSLIYRVDEKGARTVRRRIEDIGHGADRAGSSLVSMKSILGSLAGIQIFSDTLRTLRDFSQGMSTVQAITSATGDQFTALRDKAKELGSSTRFSATQAAEGMQFLARAGFNTDQTLESITGTLNLAQAGALGLGDAADIASNILTGFRLETSKMNNVVDILAFQSNRSNTNVQQLGEAMKFAAPVAAGLGVDIKETASAIGALSDAGLQGSLAGTGLRTAILQLTAPTTSGADAINSLGLSLDDVNVRTRGLIPVLKTLRDANLDVTDAVAIAGTRGGPALEVLVKSFDKVAKGAVALDDVDGFAKKVAETMDNNLNGAVIAAGSAFEGLKIEIGDLGAESGLTQFFQATTQSLRFLTANLSEVTSALKVGVATFLLYKIAASESSIISLRKAASLATQAKAEAASTSATLKGIQAEKSMLILQQKSLTSQLRLQTVESQRALIRAQLAKNSNALVAANAREIASSNALAAANSRATISGSLLGATKRGLAAAGALIAANPIGAAIIAIGSAVGLLVAFSDQIKLSSDGLVTLSGFSSELFAIISKSISELISPIKDVFSSIDEVTRKFFGKFEFSWESAIKVAARAMDTQIGIVKAAFSIMKNTIIQLPSVITDAFFSSLNGAIQLVNKFSDGVISILNRIGADIKPIEIPLLSNPAKDTLKNIGMDAAKIVTDSFNNGGVQQVVNRAFENARSRAKIEKEKTNGGTPDVIKPDVASGELGKIGSEIADNVSYIQQLRTDIFSQIRNPAVELAQASQVLAELKNASVITSNEANLFLAESGLVDEKILGLQLYKAEYERSLSEIDILRQNDLLSEEQAARAKGLANNEYLKSRLSNTQQILGQLSNFANSKNKKAAAVGKAAAIAQATIDGVLGVQKALASAPPPINFALAAVTGATAAANVANIRSQPTGFRTGGEFTIPGSGGPDSQLVPIMGTPGERVTVETPSQVRRGEKASDGGDGKTVVFATFLSEEAMNDFLSSGSFDETYINRIEANSSQIKQIVSNA